MKALIIIFVITLCTTQAIASEGDAIRYDNEHYTLLSQNKENWAADDKAVEKKLAEIRKRNGGKRPNIIYILVDDIGFGELGSRRLNYYNGYKTPSLNKVAEEGVSFMRM